MDLDVGCLTLFPPGNGAEAGARIQPSRKSKMVEVRPLGRSLETLGLVVDMTPEPAKSAGEAVAL